MTAKKKETKEVIDQSTGEIIEKEALPVPIIEQLDINKVEETVAKAEKFIEMKQRIINAALKSTSAIHWTNLGGNPYLEEAGAQRIAMHFGISIPKTVTEQIWHEDKNGKYYEFRAEAIGEFHGRKLTKEGSATSRDKFFARGRDKNGQRREKGMEEINVHDIRMKAITNCHNNLIKSILGIKKVTWEDLEKAGINIKGMTTVSYNSSIPEATTSTKKKKTKKDSDALKGANWWTSEFKGRTYFITYNENSHLDHPTLVQKGFKYNEEKKTYSREYSDEIAKLFNDNFMEEDK